MDKENKVIDSLFSLIEKLSPRCRDNVSYIYLSQFGCKIIPFCRQHFRNCKKADVKVDFLRWVIEYAKNSEEVVDFAIESLNDRNAKVRHYACLVLACSESARAIPILAKLALNREEPTSTVAGNAIAAIQSRNWYMFHRNDSPDVTYVLPMPHNPNYPEDANVDFYIKKAFPNIVPELENILGNIYVKWKPAN
jgi:hypothetical protein